jgi:CubicO group peptidase (beta-lactamase class C family)
MRAKYRYLAILAFLAVLASSSLSGTQTSVSLEEIEHQADEYFGPYLEMGNFSGAILIGKGSEILLSKGYGMANYELGVANTPQTCFQIGSLGKQLTATAIMQLNERGLLGLSDPVRKHIKEFRHGDKITIHHLLSHTSGVPELPETKVFAGFDEKKELRDNWIDSLNKEKLEFAPGSKFAYRNMNYILLSEIIIRVSGRTEPEYIRENILQPLGMDGYAFNDGRLIKGRAEGYFLVFDGFRNARFYSAMDMGASYSSVEDYFRFLRGLFDHKVLSPSSVEKMLTPNLESYGYAWNITEVENGRKLVFHGGGSTGYVCSASSLRDEDLTIIVFSNLGNISLGRIVSDLAAIAQGQPYEIPKTRKAIEIDPGTLGRYEGYFQGDDENVVQIRVDGDHLCIVIGSRSGAYSSGGLSFRYVLFPESQRVFFAKEFDGQVEFQSFESGKAERISLTVNGRCRVMTRIER